MRSSWIETFTGRKFCPLDPNPEDICIKDIAHSLSNICRYTGATRVFYSVAEHSLRISHSILNQTKDNKLALWGLLHDASEAYLTDIPRPIKASVYFKDPVEGTLHSYYEIEANLLKVIIEHFGLEWPMPVEVKEADDAILVKEKKQLLNDSCKWDWLPEKTLVEVTPWDYLSCGVYRNAEHHFIDVFKRLYLAL